jgi:hypothetical protein
MTEALRPYVGGTANWVRLSHPPTPPRQDAVFHQAHGAGSLHQAG